MTATHTTRPRAAWRRLAIAGLAIVLAWAWYRGTVYWRVRTERARLEALTGEPAPATQVTNGVGAARNLITGENDLERLRALRDAVDVAETTPR